MQFVIESGIPIPSRHHGIMEEMRNVLRQMKPGESFVVTKDNKHVYQAAKSCRVKIATRQVADDKGIVTGWRVWRVS